MARFIRQSLQWLVARMDQIFKEQFTPGFLSACNWVLEKGEILPSLREAMIPVIPNEGKDKLECASYRPLSVLNVDYKLYKSIITRRIESLFSQTQK